MKCRKVIVTPTTGFKEDSGETNIDKVKVFFRFSDSQVASLSIHKNIESSAIFLHIADEIAHKEKSCNGIKRNASPVVP